MNQELADVQVGFKKGRGTRDQIANIHWINLDSILKSKDSTLLTKVHLVKAMFFPVVMYGRECWTIKKAERWRIDAFELSLTVQDSWVFYNCKKIKPVNPEGNQSWIFIGRTDAEAETPILQPPDAKNWLTGKDPDAGKDWRQEEKGTSADEMVGWHHRLNGHEFEQAPGVGDGQGNLVCYSPWGHKESDTTERLNWRALKQCPICKIIKNILCRLSPQTDARF